MYRPLALFIGLRYTRAKRHNRFISFIAGFSVLGIALGVAVLMTVLSVMNGFNEEIRRKVFAMVPHVTVTSYQGSLHDWSSLAKKITRQSDVVGVAPYINGTALLTYNNAVVPVLLTGIEPKEQWHVSDLAEKMLIGQLNDLVPEDYGIILGANLAARLAASVGAKIIVITPEGSVTPVGFVPRVKRFTVVGIFHAGDGFNFDSSYAFIHVRDAQVLYRLGDNVSGLRLKIRDVFSANTVSEQVADLLDRQYDVSNWTVQWGAFFQAIALEKNMMFIILLFIIGVAAFNLISTLVMIVNEKRSDIAILRTLGMVPRQIIMIFIVQGAVIGFMGLILGLIGGLLLTHFVNTIADFIQHVFHVQLIAASVYSVDYLPTKIVWHDIMKILTAAFILCLLATLYPAWRAARIQPVQALRYE